MNKYQIYFSAANILYQPKYGWQELFFGDTSPQALSTGTSNFIRLTSKIGFWIDLRQHIGHTVAESDVNCINLFKMEFQQANTELYFPY